jgi:hypothetical protein
MCVCFLTDSNPDLISYSDLFLSKLWYHLYFCITSIRIRNLFTTQTYQSWFLECSGPDPDQIESESGSTIPHAEKCKSVFVATFRAINMKNNSISKFHSNASLSLLLQEKHIIRFLNFFATLKKFRKMLITMYSSHDIFIFATPRTITLRRCILTCVLFYTVYYMITCASVSLRMVKLQT